MGSLQAGRGAPAQPVLPRRGRPVRRASARQRLQDCLEVVSPDEGSTAGKLSYSCCTLDQLLQYSEDDMKEATFEVGRPWGCAMHKTAESCACVCNLSYEPGSAMAHGA